jgi:hypothetical protein
VRLGQSVHGLYQQSGKHAQVSDTAKHIDQNDLGIYSIADPGKHINQSLRVIAQAPGTDITKVVRRQAAVMEFITQHHAESGAGCQQADSALGVGHNKIKPVFVFEISLWIIDCTIYKKSLEVRLSSERIGVENDLGITQ